MGEVNYGIISIHDDYFAVWKDVDRSLNNNRNRSGPKMDPWGTPQVTVCASDSVPLYYNRCWRPDK